MTNFEEYKTHDLWDFRELKALCCGIQPNGTDYRPFMEELNDAEERIRRACFAGTLSFKSHEDRSVGDTLYGHNRFFIPADAARWAIPLFPKFPKELHDLIEPKPVIEKTPPYLDPSHPAYEEELAIAIKAWEAVLLPCPDRPKKGTRKTLIRKWLDDNYSKNELSDTAKERISVVLNPDKNGGVTKSV